MTPDEPAEGADDPAPGDDGDDVAPLLSIEPTASDVRADELCGVYDLDPGEAPSLGVTRAVATVTDRSFTSLDPIYDAVDPDALDRLVGEDDATTDRGPVRVTIEFAGRTVSVDSRGRISVYRRSPR